MTLSAAIIAGGFSRRMGRDKALLPDPIHGTLLERQLALVRTLQPIEVLVSCRPDQTLPTADHLRRVHDAGTQGPLAGLAALLAAMRGDLLLVVAVDLGRLTPEILERLVAAASPSRGVVPRTMRGAEPLAALYPASLAPAASARLAAGHDLSLRGFVEAGVSRGMLRWFDLTPAESALFANWNTPADIATDDTQP